MLGWIWPCYAPDLFALSLPPPLQHCTLQWMSDAFQKANFWHKANMPQEAAFKVMAPGCCWPDSALQTEADREERWELILKLIITLFQRRDRTWHIFPHMKISKNMWELEELDWSFAKSVGCMPFGGVKKEHHKWDIHFSSPRQRNEEQTFTRGLRFFILIVSSTDFQKWPQQYQKFN